MDWSLIGQIIWGLGLVTWVAIRVVPNRRSRKRKIATTARSPVETAAMAISFTGLGIIPLVWIFTGWPSALEHETGAGQVIVGAALFGGALILFRVTHKALGAMWSVSLDLREDHRLVTTGIYEKLRHPMYTAFWLWAVSQPFLLANWLPAFSGIVGFGTLFFLRLGREERMMEDEFGEEYRDYRARTKRVIPYIY